MMHAIQRIQQFLVKRPQAIIFSSGVPLVLLAIFMGVLPLCSFAEDGVGYSPSLNGEVTDNTVILPSSGGASVSGARPFIQLKDGDAKALVVPMPESAITQEPTHGNVKTKPMPVYIK